MPKIHSARQYGFVQAVAHGNARKETSLTPEQARAGIRELSPEKRRSYAKRIGHKLSKMKGG